MNTVFILSLVFLIAFMGLGALVAIPVLFAPIAIANHLLRGQ